MELGGLKAGEAESAQGAQTHAAAFAGVQLAQLVLAFPSVEIETAGSLGAEAWLAWEAISGHHSGG